MILNLLTLSNFAYLLPFILAIEKGYLLYSIPYFLLFITSNIYHLNHESEKYRIYDQIFAFGVIAMNTYDVFILPKQYLTSFYINNFCISWILYLF